MVPASPEPAAGRGRRWLLLVVLVVVAAGGLLPARAPAALVDDRHAAPAAPAPAPDPGRGRVPELRMPALGAVVRGFELPAGAYGPGHRGIDIELPVGERARAPTAGRVVFAGPVAGTTWVSLEVAPGVLIALGPLLDPAIATGRQVRSGTPLGRVAPGHGPPDPAPGAPPPGGEPPGPPAGAAPAGGEPADPPAGAAPAGGRPVDPAAGAAAVGGGTVTLHLSVRVDRVYVDPLPYLVDRPRPRLAPMLAPGGLARP
jgi:hypothetical protein